MKNSILFNSLLGTTFIAFCLNVSAHSNTKAVKQNNAFSGMDSEAAIVVKSFYKALRSNDKDSAKNSLAEKVVIFENGKVERSRKQYSEHHMLADMKYLSKVNSTVVEHQVYVSGNMAYSLSRSKVTGVYKGKSVDLESMETIILTKVNEQWKIIHIHWS